MLFFLLLKSIWLQIKKGVYKHAHTHQLKKEDEEMELFWGKITFF